MRKVIVNEFMTLDGVAQAPGAADEDTSGGFAHGGWHMRHADDELAQSWVLHNIVQAGGFLLGRRTYEIFASYWPKAPAEATGCGGTAQQQAQVRRLKDAERSPGWHNSTLLAGDVVQAVAALKGEDGGDLHVIGSTELVRTLIEHDLVDELRLVIDPVIVGGGKRLFGEDGLLRALRLADSQATSTGAILATYARAA